LKDVAMRLRNQAIDQQVAELMRQMSQPDITEEQTHAILGRQQELRLDKRRPVDAPLT